MYYTALTCCLFNIIYPQLYKERFFDIKFISAATGKVRLFLMNVEVIMVFYEFVRCSSSAVGPVLFFVVSVVSNCFFHIHHDSI